MRREAQKYLSLHTSSSPSRPSSKPDFNIAFRDETDAYRAILNSSLPEIDKEPDRVAQEVLTLLVGGSATTMRVMTRIVYHVASTPDVLGKLTEVLDRIMPETTSHPKLEELESEGYIVRFIHLTT